MEQDLFDIETAAYDMAVDAASEEVKKVIKWPSKTKTLVLRLYGLAVI